MNNFHARNIVSLVITGIVVALPAIAAKQPTPKPILDATKFKNVQFDTSENEINNLFKNNLSGIHSGMTKELHAALEQKSVKNLMQQGKKLPNLTKKDTRTQKEKLKAMEQEAKKYSKEKVEKTLKNIQKGKVTKKTVELEAKIAAAKKAMAYPGLPASAKAKLQKDIKDLQQQLKGL